MPLSLLPSFLVYTFVTSITPGPANICSLSAALRYGRRAALRQWRGLFVGYTIVSLCSAFAIWLVGTALIDSVQVLSWIGACYILWLAWHILRSSGTSVSREAAEPRFRTGLLVQLTNVKIMIFCLTVLASYVLPYDGSLAALLKMAVLLPFIGPFYNLIWLFAGAFMQKLFAEHSKAVDRVMAAALAACAVSLVWPH
ncbi:MAG: LysE family transporter [Pygmaiobacter massiliensis]|nr:LysE family transporter [Pygmaiobacter massiliensis]